LILSINFGDNFSNNKGKCFAFLTSNMLLENVYKRDIMTNQYDHRTIGYQNKQLRCSINHRLF